jgi:hypothetical protein
MLDNLQVSCTVFQRMKRGRIADIRGVRSGVAVVRAQKSCARYCTSGHLACCRQSASANLPLGAIGCGSSLRAKPMQGRVSGTENGRCFAT